jgi:hypothetical protein
LRTKREREGETTTEERRARGYNAPGPGIEPEEAPRMLALMACVQVSDAAAVRDREELLALARRVSVPTACGIYLQGEKAGWILSAGRIEGPEGRELLVIEEESMLRSTYEGEASSSHEWTRETYALEGRGELLCVEEREEQDGAAVERNAALEDGRFKIVVRGEGYETSREVGPPRRCLADDLRFEAWLSSAPARGASFEDTHVDLEAEAIDVPVQTRYVEPCRALLLGNFLPAHRLECETMGFEMEIVVLSDSRPVGGGIEGVLEFRLEDPQTVKDLGGDGPELTGLSIPCEEHLGDPEQVSFLELELSGAAEGALPADRRQEYFEEGGSRRLRVWRDPPDGTAAPLSEADSRRYTASTPALQSDHPMVVERARAIVGSLAARCASPQAIPSRRAAALALLHWVYDALEPTYARNASTALEVLGSRAGDCSEHALLYVALSRALGIPSRVVGGVMYCGDEVAAFAWHAWAEIHDGERWISVDSTWAQMPVDATHVKLDEDGLDGDESWINLVGRLELWVVDVERD